MQSRIILILSLLHSQVIHYNVSDTVLSILLQLCKGNAIIAPILEMIKLRHRKIR